MTLHRLREGRAYGKRQVAQKRHLLVVHVGRHEAGNCAYRAHHLEPGVEGTDFLALGWGEDPGLLVKDCRIAIPQPTLRLAGHRVPTEKPRRIG